MTTSDRKNKPMKSENIDVPVFTTKDSGTRSELANGMVRDSEDDKADYTLVLDGPLFERWVALLGRGARKYRPRNWCLALQATDRAAREKTKERFRRSAFRHFMQWMRGDVDEDHAAAVYFNLNGFEAMLSTDHLVGNVAGIPAAAADAPKTAGKLEVGARVRVVGRCLSGLSGHTGVVTQYNYQSCSWGVRFDGPEHDSNLYTFETHELVMA